MTSGERLGRKGQRRAPQNGRKAAIENVIVIGASAGGHGVLVEVLRGLSPDTPAAIVVLLHSSLKIGHALAKSLERLTPFPVVRVESFEPLRHGAAFFPPSGRSMSFLKSTVRVESVEKVTRPSTMINRTLQSAARRYGRRVIGVVLTGLLKDGTEGLRAVHEAGGITIVQDPQSAEFPDMPASAMKDLPVTLCLEVSDIGPALDLLTRRDTRLETGVAVSIRTLKERVALLVRLIGQSSENVGTYRFLIRELTSLKRDLASIEGLLKRVTLGAR